MALGGFQGVELNAAGWLAVIAPGAAGGALIAVVADVPVLPLAAAGTLLTFGLARLVDEIRERRRWSYVPVVSAETARERLAVHSIPVLHHAAAEVDGRHVEYIGVRARDFTEAARLVGLPHESRRARRRWKKAMSVAMTLRDTGGSERRHAGGDQHSRAAPSGFLRSGQ